MIYDWASFLELIGQFLCAIATCLIFIIFIAPGVAAILCAWFLTMPVWASILLTITGSLWIIFIIFSQIIDW